MSPCSTQMSNASTASGSGISDLYQRRSTWNDRSNLSRINTQNPSLSFTGSSNSATQNPESGSPMTFYSPLTPGTPERKFTTPQECPVHCCISQDNFRMKLMSRCGVIKPQVKTSHPLVQQYEGKSAEDFQSPVWLSNRQRKWKGYDEVLKQIDQPGAISRSPSIEISDNEELEKGLGDNNYQLNYITKKTNSQIRNGLLSKLANQGYWNTKYEKKPSSQSIIIFDWDDTLLPTSFLHQIRNNTNIQNQKVKKQLQILSETVYKILQTAIELSQNNTFIVTNAMQGWVEYSASIWAPQLLPILEQIPIISARDQYQNEFPNEYSEWKKQVFLEISKSTDKNKVTNIVCLGDSNIEMDAGIVLADQYSHACVKTVKFKELSSPEELNRQLDLVHASFWQIWHLAKDQSIRLSQKQESN